MARIQRKRLRVDPNEGTDFWEWHQRIATVDVDAWLAEIDAGNDTPVAKTDVPVFEIPEIEGAFDFAVVQGDEAGNRSDPSTFAAWNAVSLDLSPPPAATGGVIENVA